ILSSCQSPFHGFLATTAAGTRSHLRSFLSTVSFDGSLRFYASLRTSVPQGNRFFLPQALLPFLPTHREYNSAGRKSTSGIEWI
ncbi:MAG TPA: hypothetical protein PL045_03390, partial [Chitinophagaceae bacterium]|nr:hypothetical protein [Chitinophagaceae bacterium]